MTATPLSLELDSFKDKSYGPHFFHPYPAKFVPQIPAELIRRYTEPGQLVLDPFCGSGTTLVEALLLGRDCVGTDVNDLAVLISRAKTTPLTERQLESLEAIVDALDDPQTMKCEVQEPPPISNRDKWFTPVMQRELGFLAGVVKKVQEPECETVLKVAFAYAVGKASNQESDTVYRAIDKGHVSGAAIAAFQQRLQDMVDALREYSPRLASRHCAIKRVDITREGVKLDRHVDAVVTSPPYLNSYDYYLYHKHRMSWLGIDYSIVQREEFGSRNKHNDHGLGADAYEDAIRAHLNMISSVVKRGGYYACVVGDGIVRGQLYRADEMFDKLFADAAYDKVESFQYEQRKYTRAFTPNLRTAHKLTHVLVYRRR